MIGEIIAGMGILAITGVAAGGMYHLVRCIRSGADLEERFAVLEMSLLSKVANKKGIDIEKELLKMKYRQEQNKNFRKRIMEEVYLEMFGKDK